MGEGEFSCWQDTTVFWNLDDYAIPVGIDDLGSIHINIKEALHQFGFHGDKDIYVHCKQLELDLQNELSDAKIFYAPAGTWTYMTSVDKVTTLDMTPQLVQIALTTLDMNYAVIAKPKRELVRVLKCLASMGHTVLLIDPPEDECSFSVESLLGYAHLVLPASETTMVQEEEEGDFSQDQEYVEEDFFQGQEEDLYPYTSDVDVEEEDPSKILDFMEPIRPVKGAFITPVFWDAEDCPFPIGSTPDEIYHSIASTLVEMGFTDVITIWAYLDDDKKGSWRDALLGHKTGASRIYFFPAGDNDSRRIRMANDILFLALGSPSRPFQRTLLLVSDQFKADPYYNELLYHLSLDIVFVIPTQDFNKPESPDWPLLLIDEGYYRFAPKTFQLSHEPLPEELLIEIGAFCVADDTSETNEKLPTGDDTSQSSEGSGLAGLFS